MNSENAMIKNHLILAFANIISCFTLAAQPSISFSQFIPNFGSTYLYRDIDTSAFTSILNGANVNWNYTVTPVSKADTVFVLDPVQTPTGAIYPNATYSSLSEDTYSYYHGNASANQIHWLGDAIVNASVPSGIDTIKLQDSLLYWQFPITYNSQASDSADYVPRFFGFIGGKHYHQYIVDGYGTLTLNGQSYTNCLKAYSIDSVVNTIFGSPYADVELIKTHTWLDSSNAIGVLSYSTITYFNTFNPSSTSRLSIALVNNQLFGSIRPYAKDNLFKIKRDFKGHAFQVTTEAKGIKQLLIYDMQGKLVHDIGFKSQATEFSLNQKGIYVLQLKLERGIQQMKFNVNE
jgi:hypothetical protein